MSDYQKFHLGNEALIEAVTNFMADQGFISSDCVGSAVYEASDADDGGIDVTIHYSKAN